MATPITQCPRCGRDTRILLHGVCHPCALDRVYVPPAKDPKPGDGVPPDRRSYLREYHQRADVKARNRRRDRGRNRDRAEYKREWRARQRETESA